MGRKSKYQKNYERWDKYYRRWKKEETFCPAFGQNVLITKMGWNHLTTSRFRTKVERIERMEALPLAKKLIKVSTTHQEYRYKNGWHYFALVGIIGGVKIKVILTARDNKKEKNFFSVMVQYK
jgi:hypothetical protein